MTIIHYFLKLYKNFGAKLNDDNLSVKLHKLNCSKLQQFLKLHSQVGMIFNKLLSKFESTNYFVSVKNGTKLTVHIYSKS